MSNKIEFKPLLKADGATLVDYELGAGLSIETGEIPLESFNPNGLFTMFVKVSGSGTLTIKPVMSLSGDSADYAQDANYPVVEDFGATSGPESNGKINASVVLSVCRRVKFLLTESGGVSPVTIDKLVFGWQ